MPLCGAALTFFAAAKKDKQRKRLKPLMLSGHRSLLRVVVHLESGFVPLHVLVTRVSFFQRRCARRRVLHNTTLLGCASCDVSSLVRFGASRLQKTAITAIARELTWIPKHFSCVVNKGCFGGSQLFENNCARGIDDRRAYLHNLVSLLLMQRRRTKRCRVVEVGGGSVVNADSIFKN